MLNDAQRTSLRIVMRMIEEKMREIEFRLDHPDERALMFDVNNDLSPNISQALREKIAEVSGLIQTLRDRLVLPREVRPASRELLKGLAQLWVVLQESDSERLRRYGEVSPTLAPVLDVEIVRLAHLMLELEDIVLDHRRRVFVEAEGKRSDSHT